MDNSRTPVAPHEVRFNARFDRRMTYSPHDDGPNRAARRMAAAEEKRQREQENRAAEMART